MSGPDATHDPSDAPQARPENGNPLADLCREIADKLSGIGQSLATLREELDAALRDTAG
ncbi:MAG: hypothetical protein ABI321_02235 [Polyangia bacterium]